MFQYPAEYGPLDSVWLSWPTYENKKGLSMIPVYLQVISILLENGNGVSLAVQDQDELEFVTGKLTERSVPQDRLRCFIIPHNDIWVRDMGPIFIVNENAKKVILFDHNCHGYDDPGSEDSLLAKQYPLAVAKYLNLATVDTSLISEGGNREFNGQGIMMAVESVEQHRNPDLSLTEIEQEFARLFGVQKFIWLKYGIVEDDSTWHGCLPGPDGLVDIWTPNTTAGGHIDEICRFVREDTVLLAEVTQEEAQKDKIAAINYARIAENLEILSRETTLDGRKLNIVRIPHPVSLFSTLREGDASYAMLRKKYEYCSHAPFTQELKTIIAASYVNYIVANNVVIMPRYWKPGLSETLRRQDLEAQKVMQSIFPDRKVFAIDTLSINLGGGGLHCISQQEPCLTA